MEKCLECSIKHKSNHLSSNWYGSFEEFLDREIKFGIYGGGFDLWPVKSDRCAGKFEPGSGDGTGVNSGCGGETTTSSWPGSGSL